MHECGNWDWGCVIPRKRIHTVNGIFVAVYSTGLLRFFVSFFSFFNNRFQGQWRTTFNSLSFQKFSFWCWEYYGNEDILETDRWRATYQPLIAWKIHMKKTTASASWTTFMKTTATTVWIQLRECSAAPGAIAIESTPRQVSIFASWKESNFQT